MSRRLAVVAGWTACALLLVASPDVRAQRIIDDVQPIVLSAPPVRGQRATPGPASTAGGAPRALLVLLSSKRNRIIDTDDWFRNNGLSLAEYELPNQTLGKLGNLPPGVPRQFRGNVLLKAITQPGMALLIYGTDPTGARHLVAADLERNTYRYAYDFTNYLYPPGGDPRGRAGPQGVVWAVERDGVLYVANSHLTYARESRGMNAYITAIRAGTDLVLWRSQPLVSNAFTFEVAGDFVVSGYGFTAEPDFMYVLNRSTGDVVQRVSVRTAPEFIIRKGERLYVRGYNTDFIFGMVGIR